MPDHVSIIRPPLTPAPVPEPLSLLVTCGPFWPDISIADLRADQRVDDVVTDARCRKAIRAGIETALIDLRAWQAGRIELGYASLSDVPAEEIDGVSRLVLCWHRAVLALAKADIIETYRDYDATGAGDRAADWLDDAIIQLRRDAAHAIRDLKGRARTCVELI